MLVTVPPGHPPPGGASLKKNRYRMPQEATSSCQAVLGRPSFGNCTLDHAFRGNVQIQSVRHGGRMGTFSRNHVRRLHADADVVLKGFNTRRGDRRLIMAAVQNGHPEAPAWLQGWRLTRVKGQRPYLFWIAGPCRSWWMHWDPTALRTQPCLVNSCRLCYEAYPKRPLSYLPVYEGGAFNDGTTWRRTLLEVPFRTGLRLTDMQGRPVCLRRRGTCGVIDITPATLRARPENSQAWDIVPQLLALWRIARSEQLSLVSSDPVY